MVLHQDKKDVITSFGSAVPKKFSIAANAKSFKILSDSLYKDKIRAIIRELSTNALDSHMEAGKKDVPFYVFLPTQLDPHFEIRDYGIGLSEEDVLNLYSTYFDSDKDQNNNAIGAFGLGSKTPFAYVSSFTVTSWFEGQKKIYTAYIDEDKVPNIVKVHEEASEESNGLSVSFSVRELDISTFYDRAALVYRPFEVKPKFNDPNFEVHNYNKLYEGSNFFLSEEYENYRRLSYKAIYGNIEYPISEYEIDESEAIREFGYAVRKGGTLYVQFTLGELDVALSREELSYDEQTKENLKNRLESVIDEITKEMDKEIQSQKNFWKARKVFHKYRNYKRFLTRTYKGLDLLKQFWIDKDKVSVFSPQWQINGIVCSRPDRRKLGYYLNTGDKDYVFFKYDSLPKGKAEARIRGLAKKNYKKYEDTELILIHDFSVFGKYDIPKCIQVEDLPEESYKEEKTNSTKGKKKNVRIAISRNKYFDDHNLEYSSIEELEKDKDKLVLFPVFNSETHLDTSCSKTFSLINSFDYIEQLPELEGFKFRYVHHSELNKKRFQDYIERVVSEKPFKEIFEAIKHNEEFVTYVQTIQKKMKSNSNLNIDYNQREVLEKLFEHKDSLINGYKDRVEKYWSYVRNDDYGSNQGISQIYSLLNRINSSELKELEKELLDVELKEGNTPLEIQEFLTKEFPLLSRIRTYGTDFQDVVDYVNSVSESRKNQMKETA